ncbi:NIF3-like protein 1 [Mytilus californianus]|uniref:NIF3-like protein 1 n=1 Tax=Mytilus californianus TaxID=6549 RepID=UPI002247EA10|nr:NIF3-like protein 1 [Mytilus californianus]XP_052072669.1 NIF3-like protein 1 [Mytilus californianus]
MLSTRLFSTIRSVKVMELKEVVKKLNQFAPTSLAEKWDNVGLLVEPSSPLQIKKIMLTNDLTPPVMDEAVAMGTNLIISYHPPIFTGMKCVTQKTWKERIVTTCLENRIGVFSPHTSYDCVQDGVNDWLIKAFDIVDVRPIQHAMELHSNMSNSISCCVPRNQCDQLQEELSGIPHVKLHTLSADTDDQMITVGCSQNNVSKVVTVMNKYTAQFIEVKQMSKVPKAGYGMGRIGKLKNKLTVDEAIQKVKSHLQLGSIRIAKSPDANSLETVAVCAGSGGSLLKDVRASLYLTGEMSHHDVLHAVYSGTNVILCDHSNTERGFLKHLKMRLEPQLPGVDIFVSAVDKDPLEIV